MGRPALRMWTFVMAAVDEHMVARQRRDAFATELARSERPIVLKSSTIVQTVRTNEHKSTTSFRAIFHTTVHQR